MARYIEPTAQLVVELFVRDLARARAFYEALGFATLDDRGDFVVLTWEDHQLFLDERRDLPPPSAPPQANVRVMVPDVDRYWARAQALGARVLVPIADRDYGLRDFTILDPDGFGVRFATRIATGPPPRAAAPPTPGPGTAAAAPARRGGQPLQVLGYSWLGVRTDNFDAAVRFFAATLDLPLATRDEDRDFALFRLPSGQLVEIFGPRDAWHDFMTAPVAGFEVADVRAARAELATRGVPFATPVRDWGGGAASTYFRDPDGHLFELWQRGA